MKKKLFPLLSISASVLITATLITSCKKDEAVPTPTPALKNIVEIVVENPNFSLLKQAVVKAGLSSALSSGSLTVFAPDNAAFQAADIDSTDIASLPDSLIGAILKYHVLGTKKEAAGVPESDTLKTLNGLNIFASRNSNGVFVNGIKVKTANIQASNGVIHVISDVLNPPTESIASLVSDDDNFDLLLTAVVHAGLANTLSRSGKFTVFAPTDEAFADAGFTSETSITNLPDTLVAKVLLSHVIGTNVFASDLTEGASAPTLQQGVTLAIALSPVPSVKLTGSSRPASKITKANIVTTNGVIHVIDRVLLN
jgi:uncharacterized surface protein with fasciclin (FAS1) repeats